jgi:hypothetical protein
MEQLDCHDPVERQIAGSMNYAHAAASDFIADLKGQPLGQRNGVVRRQDLLVLCCVRNGAAPARRRVRWLAGRFGALAGRIGNGPDRFVRIRG